MSKEEKVGAVVLVLLGAAVAAVLALGGRHFAPGIHLHVEMARIGALQEGDAVRIAGLELGTIERIRLERDHAILDLWIRKKHAWLVRDTSEFFVNQPGVLGEPYLEIGERPDTAPGTPLADGATVRGVDPPRLDRLLAIGYENVRAFMDLVHHGLPELTELRAELDALAKTLDEIQPAPGEGARAWAAARRAFAEAGALGDAARATGVDAERLRQAGGRAARLVADAQAELAPLRAKLDAAARLATLLGRVSDDPRFARFAAAVDQAQVIADRAWRVVAGAQAIIAAVESGKGTIGAFLHDDALADELKETSKILKRRPWEALGHPQTRGRHP